MPTYISLMVQYTGSDDEKSSSMSDFAFCFFEGGGGLSLRVVNTFSLIPLMTIFTLRIAILSREIS